MMGMAGRLEEGKVGNFIAPYGYSKTDDGRYIVNPDKAQWVQKLFRWYGEGVALTEIRRRLVEADAPQRKQSNRRPWHLATLRKFMHSEHYWSGVHRTRWDGQVYEIPIPAIVTAEEVRQVQTRREQYKTYPAGNAKHDALAAGIIYCAACGTRLRVVNASNGYTRKDGTRGRWTFYECATYGGNRTNDPGCVRRVGAKAVDEQIWAKVWTLLSKPGVFEDAWQQRIAELQSEETGAEADVSRLERPLDDLAMERQKVIVWARKGVITEEDLSTQLLGLSVQEKALQRELSDKRLLIGNRAGKLIDLAQTFRAQVQAGFGAINAAPTTEEQAKRQKAYRRQIVQSIVKRVWLHQDKKVVLELEIDLPDVVSISEPVVRLHSGYG